MLAVAEEGKVLQVLFLVLAVPVLPVCLAETVYTERLDLLLRLRVV
jgi:hypothetical protein